MLPGSYRDFGRILALYDDVQTNEPGFAGAEQTPEEKFRALLDACENSPSVCGSVLLGALYHAGDTGTAGAGNGTNLETIRQDAPAQFQLNMEKIDTEVGAEGGAAGAAADTTRVGRWMSQYEFDQMSGTGRVQEGAGGRTYVSNPPDPDVWRGAAPGSIYAEFDVPTSSLFRAGNPGWGVIPGPNVTTGLYGPPPLEMPYATSIEWMFDK